MADDINVGRESQTDGPAARPGNPQPRQPGSAAEARRRVDDARGRISADLDAIEHRIDRKTQKVRQKADMLRPVREQLRRRPWPAVGAALGAGFVLGVLSGEDDRDPREELIERMRALEDEEQRERERLHSELEAEREARREEEARWQEQARRQEEARRRANHERAAGKRSGGDWTGGALDKLQRTALKQIGSALTAAITGAVTSKMSGRSGSNRGARSRTAGETPTAATGERPGAGELRHSHTHER